MLGYVVRRDEKDTFRGAVEEVERPIPHDGDLVVQTAYSSLNFKDGLAAAGNPAVVRKTPHIPGIDLAGVVLESHDDRFKAGDEVVSIGYELGVERWGGWAQEAVVMGEHTVHLPKEFSLKTAMILGTAGWTAMDSVVSLEEQGVLPTSGEIIVTGAGGGVGRLAVLFLAQRGYRVAAVTGREGLTDELLAIGAERVIPRTEIIESYSAKPVLKEKWAGVVDVVGGPMLAHLLKELHPHGSAAICGLVGGADLATSVLPFILRGIHLIGIDSVWPARGRRAKIWAEIAKQDLSELDPLANEVTLGEVGAHANAILQGQVAGRVLVKPVA